MAYQFHLVLLLTFLKNEEVCQEPTSSFVNDFPNEEKDDLDKEINNYRDLESMSFASVENVVL